MYMPHTEHVNAHIKQNMVFTLSAKKSIIKKKRFRVIFPVDLAACQMSSEKHVLKVLVKLLLP